MTTKLKDFVAAFKVLILQLYLSVTSSSFYYKVHKYYKGYGIKYIFTVSVAASMIYVIVIFNMINNLNDYFLYNKNNKTSVEIDYIINQLPTLFFNGKSISIEEDAPIFLYDPHKNKVGAIDPANTLKYKEKIKIPIILTKTAIMISLNNKESFSLSYGDIFNDKINIITAEILKKELGAIIKKAKSLFIYLGMPLLVLIRFIIDIFENFFIIILIYLLSKVLGIQTTLKTSIRVAMFSSGILIILRPFFLYIAPITVSFLWALGIWTNLLVLLALLKLRKENSVAY